MADHPPSGIKDLDAVSLKALAHPLRVRMLAALRAAGPATASTLGRQFGESSGATSYHLRQLARHGFIEEELGRGTTRERWWRAAHRSTRWNTSPRHSDPATAEASTFLMRHQAEYEQRAVQHWLTEQDSWSAEWLDAADSSDARLRMRPERLRRMTAEMNEVLQRYSAEDDTDGEHVAVFVRAFPQHRLVL